MNDQQWDDLRSRIQAAYNAPSETPREDMWAAISEQLPQASDLTVNPELRAPGAARASGIWRRRSPWIAAAAALVLALGYGLGRWTAPAVNDQVPQVAEIPGPESEGPPQTGVQPGSVAQPGSPTPVQSNPGVRTAYRFAAARHLAASSSFLGRIQSGVREGAVPADAGEWARHLLTDTRLILDSPAVDESELRSLLEDLELLLLQIAHASGAQQSGQSDLGRIELQQLNRGLDQNDLRARIQRMVPPMLSSDL